MGKPKLELTGENGNAFAILGRARAALKKHLREQGKTPLQVKDEVERFTREATSGDYDHLLIVVNQWFEVE